MWTIPGRIASAFADLTAGTAIVLFHVALVDRRAKPRDPLLQTARDGTRIWRSQISP